MREVLGEKTVLLPASGISRIEEGLDYRENALAKARAGLGVTGGVTLADDSGLEVEGLGGAPGPLSARFGGEGLSDAERVEHLLRGLEGISGEGRRARFRCVAAAILPSGEELVSEGIWEGRIIEAPRGEGGFGYDPVFEDPETGMTAARMTPSEKDARSHRGKAFRGLGSMLAVRLGIR